MCLNKLKGYSGSIVSWLSSCIFGSGIGFGFVWSSCFSIAWTSFFLREGLALYAITGGDGKMWLSSVLFLISAQCFLKIFLILSSEYCVVKISLLGCLVLTFLVGASFLSLNGMSLTWLIIWSCLYLYLSLCISSSVIDVKFHLSWLGIYVSPLAIALMDEGG